MGRYIAYFDYLGYKQFIENNTADYLDKMTSNILRDIEDALGQGKHLEGRLPGTVVADITTTRIFAINFSDTVLFWTNGDSQAEFSELLEVAFRYNSLSNRFFFPVRGTIVFGELNHRWGHLENEFGGGFRVNQVYGKGLVRAHEKAENMSMAGCIVDSSVIERINDIHLLDGYVIQHLVPYKKMEAKQREEYLLRLFKGESNTELLSNTEESIQSAFQGHNKRIDNDRVRDILKNTIAFLHKH